MTSSVGTRFERLVEIMRRLRAPDGCPWDRQQTHASLRPFVIEETYEVLEAIESGTPDELCDELGDFLFEAVFLARLSEEAGDFTIGDAIDAICHKLVRRHPHVFDRPEGSAPLTSEQVVERWEVLKAREREAAGTSRQTADSVLDGVPKTLPALLRAYEVSARAAAVGFDWAGPGDVVDKVEEEAAELRRAVQAGTSRQSGNVEEEMGDLLFSIVNLARKLGVEPESALRRANDKFVERFRTLESNALARGRTLGEMSLAEMEAEWQRVKTELAHRDE